LDAKDQIKDDVDHKASSRPVEQKSAGVQISGISRREDVKWTDSNSDTKTPAWFESQIKPTKEPSQITKGSQKSQTSSIIRRIAQEEISKYRKAERLIDNHPKAFTHCSTEESSSSTDEASSIDQQESEEPRGKQNIIDEEQKSSIDIQVVEEKVELGKSGRIVDEPKGTSIAVSQSSYQRRRSFETEYTVHPDSSISQIPAFPKALTSSSSPAKIHGGKILPRHKRTENSDGVDSHAFEAKIGLETRYQNPNNDETNHDSYADPIIRPIGHGKEEHVWTYYDQIDPETCRITNDRIIYQTLSSEEATRMRDRSNTTTFYEITRDGRVKLRDTDNLRSAMRDHSVSDNYEDRRVSFSEDVDITMLSPPQSASEEKVMWPDDRRRSSIGRFGLPWGRKRNSQQQDEKYYYENIRRSDPRVIERQSRRIERRPRQRERSLTKALCESPSREQAITYTQQRSRSGDGRRSSDKDRRDQYDQDRKSSQDNQYRQEYGNGAVTYTSYDRPIRTNEGLSSYKPDDRRERQGSLDTPYRRNMPLDDNNYDGDTAPLSRQREPSRARQDSATSPRTRRESSSGGRQIEVVDNEGRSRRATVVREGRDSRGAWVEVIKDPLPVSLPIVGSYERR